MPSDVAKAVRTQTNTSATSARTFTKLTDANQDWTLNGLNAEASIPSGVTTQYLVARDFGFSILDTAVIEGAQFTISRSGTADLYDSAVRLVASGAAEAGISKAKTGVWVTEGSGAVYGGTADDWKYSITPDLVNTRDFGVAIRVVNNNASGTTAYVYGVTCTLTYDFLETREGRVMVYSNKLGNTNTVNPTKAMRPASWIMHSGRLHDNYKEAAGDTR